MYKIGDVVICGIEAQQSENAFQVHCSATLVCCKTVSDVLDLVQCDMFGCVGLKMHRLSLVHKALVNLEIGCSVSFNVAIYNGKSKDGDLLDIHNTYTVTRLQAKTGD